MSGTSDRDRATSGQTPYDTAPPPLGAISHRPGPDGWTSSEVIWSRDSSSLHVLLGRIRSALIAAAGYEAALRSELQILAAEATLLSKMTPLLPSRLASRQRVAVERDATGRGAS
jgi:hypothetical protein